jgi:hypothetical protein
MAWLDTLKTPQKWLRKLAHAVAPRPKHEHRQQRLTAMGLILVAVVALFYQALTGAASTIPAMPQMPGPAAPFNHPTGRLPLPA